MLLSNFSTWADEHNVPLILLLDTVDTVLDEYARIHEWTSDDLLDQVTEFLLSGVEYDPNDSSHTLGYITHTLPYIVALSPFIKDIYRPMFLNACHPADRPVLAALLFKETP